MNADTGSAHDETSSSGNKEDEDDDDDESDDKIDAQTHDPERLKAFNVSSRRDYEPISLLQKKKISLLPLKNVRNKS